MVKRLVLLDIGHTETPRFPTGMFGSMGYIIPFVSLYERIIGPGKDKKNVTRYAFRGEPQIDGELLPMKDKIRFGLKNYHYLRRAMSIQPESINSGLNLLLALYRVNLPNKMKEISVVCNLIYGTYVISEKDERIFIIVRNQFWTKHSCIVAIWMNKSNFFCIDCSLCKAERMPICSIISIASP